MLTPEPTAMPAPAREVRPSKDRTSPWVLTADMVMVGVVREIGTAAQISEAQDFPSKRPKR